MQLLPCIMGEVPAQMHAIALSLIEVAVSNSVDAIRNTPPNTRCGTPAQIWSILHVRRSHHANALATINVPMLTAYAALCRDKEMVILGTQYAGEMKKGIFTVMHYLMPKRGILSLHSGCNVGKNDDVTLFFGLSGMIMMLLLIQSYVSLSNDQGW